jgi:hypothetical protein
MADEREKSTRKQRCPPTARAIRHSNSVRRAAQRTLCCDGRVRTRRIRLTLVFAPFAVPVTAFNRGFVFEAAA